MPCLLVVIALMVPRVTMVVIFLLTQWFQAAFSDWVWPVLGFVFMPYTTLAYMAAVLNTSGPLTPGWVVLIIIAVVVDMGHWGGGYRWRGRRE